jgi:hypothetical protein
MHTVATPSCSEPILDHDIGDLLVAHVGCELEPAHTDLNDLPDVLEGARNTPPYQRLDVLDLDVQNVDGIHRGIDHAISLPRLRGHPAELSSREPFTYVASR